MKNIIATWICIDDKTNGTYFPSSKGNSSDLAVQQIYWRCVCTFFWSARFNNPDAHLVLFSNQQHLPQVNGLDVGDLLKNYGVQFYVTPFEYITPPGYYGEWRNQFYEFSIFKFITHHKDFSKEDQFVLLDSDCIITGSLSPLYQRLQQQQCITYLIEYNINSTINGNSRKDMKEVFEALLSKKLTSYPGYHGGEFFAATVQVMGELMEDFYVVWQQLLRRHAAGLPKLNEEAHVLSYLFFKNNIQGGQANEFIKRLWTDPTTYRNVENDDVNLLIWHLPAEKRRGFKKLFDYLKGSNFDLTQMEPARFQQLIRRSFLVPNIPLLDKTYFGAKQLYKKYLSARVGMLKF